MRNHIYMFYTEEWHVELSAVFCPLEWQKNLSWYVHGIVTCIDFSVYFILKSDIYRLCCILKSDRNFSDVLCASEWQILNLQLLFTEEWHYRMLRCIVYWRLTYIDISDVLYTEEWHIWNSQLWCMLKSDVKFLAVLYTEFSICYIMKSDIYRIFSCVVYWRVT